MSTADARIGVHAAVQLAIRGTGGTPRRHLDELASQVQQQLPGLRACYRALVQDRPAAEGAYRVTVQLSAQEAPKLAIESRGGSDPALGACVQSAFDKATFGSVPRPAAAVVVVQAQNSGAAGSRLTSRPVEDDLVVETGEPSDDPTGPRIQGRWSAPDGQIALAVHTVAAGEPGDTEAVTDALRALRASFASLLDCRRRAGRRGASAVGSVRIELQPHGAAPRLASSGGSTLSDRAQSCVMAAIQRRPVRVHRALEATVRFQD